MHIELKTNYKSLTPFIIDLPRLTIITGINGAGKSQFLDALSTGVIPLFKAGTSGTQKRIQLVTISSLSPRNVGEISPQQIKNRGTALHRKIVQNRMINRGKPLSI